jgi:alpha-ketoglutarate-dependent taurine dioxygenase
MTLNWTHEPGAPATVFIDAPTDTDAASWIDDNREELRRALTEHGALFLRGLPVYRPVDFAAVRDVLFSERAAYKEKATPRSDFGDDVFSSTDLPPAHAIRMHNENSYTLTFPGLLLFGCLVAPTEGGATPVADVRQVLKHLPEDLIERFRKHGWRLTRTYAEHVSLSWRVAFGAESPEDVDRYCEANGIETQWGADDMLRTNQVRPATIRHPLTHEEVWFNHVAFWNEWSLESDIRDVMVDEFGHDGLPFNTSMGDGTPLTPAEVALINEAYNGATVRRSWEAGDLLLVDNVLAAHGREPFSGDRQIVVGMGEPLALADCFPSLAVPAAGPAPREP